jgi:hypothetical protein
MLKLNNMAQTISFRRRIQDHGDYFLVSLPPSIVRSLESKDVDLIVENGTIKLNPVQENNKEDQL